MNISYALYPSLYLKLYPRFSKTLFYEFWVERDFRTLQTQFPANSITEARRFQILNQ
jgi:hypothetical protein